MKLPPITIIDAVNDPNVFGPWFKDKSTWAAWIVFLKVLFALQLDDAELQVFRTCTGRDAPSLLGYLTATLVVGRRGGKSLIMALCAIFLGCFFDWSPYLTGGEKASIVIVAADRRQAAVILRYAREMLAIQLLAGMIQRETQDTIELSNGVTIEIQTASWRSIRGRTVVVALADEMAFWDNGDSANPDTEIVAALRPSMATVPMARMLIASSPYAKCGVLWDHHERHFGRNESATLVWQADTRTMNPSVPQSFIDAAYEDDPASAAAEYGALFRSDVQVLFNRDAIKAVTVNGRLELRPAYSLEYSAFCDPSGGSADSMTLAIGHMEGETAVLDAIRECRPPFSPENVVDEFCTLLKSYRITTVTGDRYAGEWPREQFSKRGIYYRVSERTASQIYLEFLPMLNAGRVELLDHKRGLAQLAALERKTSRTGRDLISHPPSGHDDISVVIAGALLGVESETHNAWTSVPFWQGIAGPDDAIDDADENFLAAAKEYASGGGGDLSPRDTRWFLLERQRRATRGRR